MDINGVYNKIVEKLKASNNDKVIAEFQNSAAGAATGSEALMTSATYLSNLKHKNPPGKAQRTVRNRTFYIAVYGYLI